MQNDGLRLQFNRLQIIAKLALDACNACDTAGYILIHGPLDLQQHVDALRVQLEGSVELTLLVKLVSLAKASLDIGSVLSDLLNVREHLADMLGLEWQVLVVGKDILLGDLLDWCALLFVLFALGSLLGSDRLIDAVDNGLDFIAKEHLSRLVSHELNTQHAAQIAHQRRFSADTLKARKLLLLSRKLMAELGSSDFLNLFIDLTRSDTEESWRQESVKTLREHRLGKKIINAELINTLAKLLRLLE